MMQIMENRKLMQKRFCMFDKVKSNGTTLNEIRFSEAVLKLIQLSYTSY